MELTAIVPTFLRHRLARITVKRLRRLHPELPIIVGNDGAKDITGLPDDVQVMRFPQNIGLSASRNRMVEAAKTDRILLMDDDWWIPDRHTVPRLLGNLEREGCDISAGVMVRRIFPGRLHNNHWFGCFRQDGDTLIVERRLREGDRCDMTDNFFVADRDVLLERPWDESLKNGEHAAFFFDHWGKSDIMLDQEAVVQDFGLMVPWRLRKEYHAHRKLATERRTKSLESRGIKEFRFEGGE